MNFGGILFTKDEMKIQAKISWLSSGFVPTCLRTACLGTRGAFHKTCHKWQMTVFVISYWNPCFWLVVSRFVTDFCHLSLKKGFVKQVPEICSIGTFTLKATTIILFLIPEVINMTEKTLFQKKPPLECFLGVLTLHLKLHFYFSVWMLTPKTPVKYSGIWSHDCPRFCALHAEQR